MKFNEIFPEFAAGKPIHRKVWSAYSKISNKENLSLSKSDYNADDWEVWEKPSYHEFLEEFKDYLYYDLEFDKNRQSQYHPKEKADIYEVWSIIENYYLDNEVIIELLKHIKDNKLAKKRN